MADGLTTEQREDIQNLVNLESLNTISPQGKEYLRKRREAGLPMPPVSSEVLEQPSGEQPGFDTSPFPGLAKFFGETNIPGGLVRAGAETAGTIGLEALINASPQIPPPLKTPARLGAASIGGAGITGLVNMLQHAGLAPGEPSENIGKEMGLTALFGLGGQGVGETLNRTKLFGSGLLKDKQVPGAAQADELLAPYGTHVPIPEKTDASLVDLAANITEGSVLGNTTISKVVDKNNKILGNMIDDLANTVIKGTSKEEAGFIVQKTLLEEYSHLSGLATQRARELDRDFFKMFPEFEGSLQFALGAKNFKARKTMETSRFLKEGGEQIVTDASHITAEQMMRVLVKLDGMPSRLGKSPELRQVKSAITRSLNTMKKDLDKLIKSVPGIDQRAAQAGLSKKELSQQFATKIDDMKRLAQKENKDLANTTFIKKLAETKPDHFMNALIDTKLGPSTIAKARQMVLNQPNGAQIWKNSQAHFMNLLLTKVSKDGTLTSFNAPALKETFDQFKNSGILKEIFHGAKASKDLNRLEKIVNAIAVNNRQQKSNIGKFVIQMRQGGMLVNVIRSMTGAAQVAGAGVVGGLTGPILFLGGPVALGRMLTNKKINDFLLEGLSDPAKQGVDFMARLAALAIREGFQVEQPRSQQQDQQSSLSQMSQSGAF